MGKKKRSWTVNKGDILREFSDTAMFELGEKIFKNFFHGKLWLGQDRSLPDNACQLSFYFCETYDKASSLRRFEDDPYLLKVHAVKQFTSCWMVVLDAVPEANFQKWKENKKAELWRKNGSELYRPAPILIKFFKQLFGTVQRMHCKGIVHCGISEQTLFVTSSGDIRLFPAIFHSTDLDLKNAISIDLGDVSSLVAQLVSIPGQPEEFKCFSDLRRLKVRNADEAQNLSFFLLNSPLSWDSSDRHIFFEKIWNLKYMENEEMFKTLLSKWSKSDWKQKLMSSNLKRIYERRKEGYEKNPSSVVVDLPHNAYNHLRGRKDPIVWLDSVDRILHMTITEACPAAYFALVNNFFTGQVILTGPNLVDFFKEPPTFCLSL